MSELSDYRRKQSQAAALRQHETERRDLLRQNIADLFGRPNPYVKGF